MNAELMAALAAVLGGLVGAGLMVIMFRARVMAASVRNKQLEAQRQQLAQQTTAARRQVEALQKEVGELRHLMARRGINAPARENPGLDTLQNVELDDDKGAAAGFAATQVIARGGER